jgi:hypothetical protein
MVGSVAAAVRTITFQFGTLRFGMLFRHRFVRRPATRIDMTLPRTAICDNGLRVIPDR